MTTYIYGLIDPFTHKVSYIGRTIHPYDRLDAHIVEAAKTLKGDWIRKLVAANVRPTIVILDSFEDGPVNEIEKWWIEFGRRAGWPLTNTAGMDSEKYNFQNLPINGAINGFWEDGVWISSEEWYSLPDTIITDDLGYGVNLAIPHDVEEMNERKLEYIEQARRQAAALPDDVEVSEGEWQ